MLGMTAWRWSVYIIYPWKDEIKRRRLIWTGSDIWLFSDILTDVFNSLDLFVSDMQINDVKASSESPKSASI